MKIDEACVECIVNQTKRVCDAIDANDTLRTEIALHVESMSQDFDTNLSPAENATPIYEVMSKLAHKEDLYKEQKREATLKALALIDSLRDTIENSSDKLLSATKIAIAGNVIDLAAEVSFDLDDELKKIFKTPFAIDSLERMRQSLSTASELLVVGDNAGEHIFDLLFMQTLKELYPSLHIYYMTRGKYIINDITLQDCKGYGFEEVCELVNSGVPTPGFVYDLANEKAQAIFDKVDVVITKGMGNYECLGDYERENICFLLKIKCQVVANSLEKEIGDLICYYKD